VPAAVLRGMMRSAAWQGALLPLLLASLSGWLAVVWIELRLPMAQLCRASLSAGREPDPADLAWLVLASAAMVLAMMPLLLAGPVGHLWTRSLARRRWRALALFALTYGVIWTMAALVLLVVAAAVAGTWLGATLVLALALAWQCTPARQRCLSRCHRLPRLAAFGWAADRDCLAYGAAAALWCIGACWALMLLAMLLAEVHLVGILVVSVFLIAERRLPARAERWRLPCETAL
jgi:predicted metal-binding membrane protein